MAQRKLYYTPNSPYARIARVAIRKSGLVDQIEEIEAKTRDHATSYFDVTPLARVPVFVDGDVQLADTRDICAYLDDVTGRARWFPNESHEERYLRHIACGFLDGIAVWLRENSRPEGHKSEPIMSYEEHRASNALKWLEIRWKPVDDMNYTSLVLACTIQIALDRGLGRDWQEFAPQSTSWALEKANDPDMKATEPFPL